MVNFETRSTVAAPDPAAPARPCPHCASTRVGPLQKASDDFNTCYRCHRCGHVFSPRSW